MKSNSTASISNIYECASERLVEVKKEMKELKLEEVDLKLSLIDYVKTEGEIVTSLGKINYRPKREVKRWEKFDYMLDLIRLHCGSEVANYIRIHCIVITTYREHLSVTIY